MLKIHVTIDAKTAIQAGRANVGTFPVEIGDSFVAGLGPVEREVLLGVLKVGIPTMLRDDFNSRSLPNQPAEPVEATPEAVRKWLSEAAATVLADREKKAEEKRQGRAKQEETLNKFLSMTVDEIIQVKVEKDYRTGLTKLPSEKRCLMVNTYSKGGIPSDLYTPDEKHPRRAEYDALQASITSRLESLRGAESVRLAAEEAVLLESFAREKEVQQQTIREFVGVHGTPSQVARLAEGVLPQKELLDLVRNRLYSHLEERFQRYQRLDKSDAEHGPDCPDHFENIQFEVSEAKELSEAAYKTLVELRAVAGEDFEIKVRAHSAECMNEGCPGAVVRLGALVSLDWNGLSLSREYAL